MLGCGRAARGVRAVRCVCGVSGVCAACGLASPSHCAVGLSRHWREVKQQVCTARCTSRLCRCVEAVWCVRNGFGCSASPTAASNASVISSQT